MKKDVAFKRCFHFEGYSKMKKADSKKDKFEFYSPDFILSWENKFIIVEHSSTGDRKVHISELFQFIKLASLIKEKNFSFLLFLMARVGLHLLKNWK